MALDFLHNECHVIHTDLKADNVMLGIKDDSIYDKLEKMEIEDPIPRKEVAEGRLIYMSREMPRPKRVSHPVLCDFGSAMFGDNYREEFAQPNIYRAPEVILSIPWTYSIIIWNVGCMIRDMYEGEGLFRGYDPEFERYRSRKDLAEMINLLGPPPLSLLRKVGGKMSSSPAKAVSSSKGP